MKGIILAGGNGTRLYPSTKSISKQLLPIYDKPMIYYPIASLAIAGIRDILIISTPRDIQSFQDLLQDGSSYGLHLSYAIQEEPKGIAQAFIIGEKFIDQKNVCLILGDNLFYGEGLETQFQRSTQITKGATIFAYRVDDPGRYGVVAFNKEKKVISIEEKPKIPKSNYAITGIYFYDHNVVNFAKSLKPSQRGELEITDINKIYLERQELHVEMMGRGQAWLDTGTHDSMLEASNFIQTIEKRQGMKIACLEEIAYRKGWLNSEQIKKQLQTYQNNTYTNYVMQCLNETNL